MTADAHKHCPGCGGAPLIHWCRPPFYVPSPVQYADLQGVMHTDATVLLQKWVCMDCRGL